MGSDETHTAFFYGTLMAREVFFTVCYRGATDNVAVLKSLHKFHPAMLPGYCRRRVQYADYPGITPDKDHEVRGMYVTGLTSANMYKLDQFEGSEYDRKTVKVRLLPKSGNADPSEVPEEVETEVYVYKNPAHLEDREWDFEEFRSQRMKLWTREDYGFEDTDHLATEEVDEAKSAAV